MVTGIDGNYYSFECAAIYNGRCYFVDFDGNSICSFELNDDKVKEEIVLPENVGVRMFSAMIISDGIAYIFPFNAKGIYKVNLDTKEIVEVDYPISSGLSKNDSGKFISAYSIGNKIYGIGSSWPIIMEINSKTSVIRNIDLGFELEEYVKDNSERSFFCKGYVYNNILYVPCCKANIVVCFDCNKGDYTIEVVNNVEDGFSSIFVNDKVFWLSSRKYNCVYGGNNIEKVITKYILEKDKFVEKLCAYIDFIEMDGNIIITGFTSNSSFKYNQHKSVFENINNPIFKGQQWTVIKSRRETILSSVDSGKIIIIINENIRELRLRCNFKEKKSIIKENIIDSLEGYIDFIEKV